MLKSSRILRHRGLLTLLIIAVILIADQCLKIWVKTHFYLGESYPIFSWFELVFVQNNGMAFGWEIGSKLLLTLFRIAAVAFISFYIWRIYARHEARTGYLRLRHSNARTGCGHALFPPMRMDMARMDALGRGRTLCVFPSRIQHRRLCNFSWHDCPHPFLFPADCRCAMAQIFADQS